MIAQVKINAQRFGKDEVTVRAFAARKFQFNDNGSSGMVGAPPYEL